MKINKLLLICLIIGLLNFCSAQKLSKLIFQQLPNAQKLHEEVFRAPIDDPCDLSNQLFTCKQLTPGNDEFYVIDTITIKYTADVTLITTSFKDFEHATSIFVDERISFRENLFSHLPQIFFYKSSIQFVNLEQRIPTDVTLPYNLTRVVFNKISVPLPIGFFNVSSELEYFQIDYPEKGFEFPDPFPRGSNIKTFITTMTTYAKFPPYPTSTLRLLEVAKIGVDNLNSYAGYVGYDLPMFDGHKTLQELHISFTSPDPNRAQLFGNVLKLENIPTLRKFVVEGRGLRLNSELNLSKMAKGSVISITNTCDSLFQCPSSKCVKLPLEAELSVSGCAFSMNNVDIKNIKSLSIAGNTQSEVLPYDSSMNWPAVTKWSLGGNKYSGSMPNEYCYIKVGSLKVSDNSLSGNVPTCFSCVGGSAAASINLFPNSFSGFTLDTPATDCPTMAFDSYYDIVKTDGSSKITIRGTDFGWDTVIDSGVATIDITVPNRELIISVPKGVGKGSVVAGFSAGHSKKQTFNYVYEAPTITSYSYTEYNDQVLFTVQGSGFNFLESNNVTLNGKNLVAPIAVSDGQLNQIIFPFEDNPTKGLQTGEEFAIYMYVDGQRSNVGTFKFFGSVTVETTGLRLSTLGGDIELDGYFATDDISLVKVYINKVPCNIYELSSTKLKFAYPAVPGISHYPMEIIVGGLKFSQMVEYIELPTSEPTFSESLNNSNSILSLLKLSTTMMIILVILILN